MGLDDPLKKMSKSAVSANNYIAMTDSADTIRDKIKRAVTDSGSEIKIAKEKPAISNLIRIFSEISDRDSEEIERDFQGKGYGDFKLALADAMIDYLAPIQERYTELLSDKEELVRILKDGAEKLQPSAVQKIADVKNKVGLGINV